MSSQPRPVYSIWIRIERIPGPAGAAGTATFRVSFRDQLLDSWTYIGAPCPESALPGGLLPTGSQRLAIVSNNANSGASCTTYVDDFRVQNRICQAAGQTRFVTAGQSPIVVGGLTPGGEYAFSVTPATPSIVGAPSPSSPEVLLPQPPALNYTLQVSATTTNSILTSFMATTLSAGGAVGGNAANGVNGNTNASNYFMTAQPCGDFGCYWQVDMGQEVDVMWVSLYNYAGAAAAAANIAIFVSNTNGGAFAELGRLCSPAPPSLLDPTQGYYADVPCFNNVGVPLTGRYVTIQAPMGVALSLTQVLVYAGNNCPAYGSTNAIPQAGSTCGAGAPFGASCAMTCPPGTEVVSGATLAHCRGYGWDQPPLLCQPTCAPLLPPSNVSSCSESLVVEHFDPLPDNTTVGRWFAPDPSEGLGVAFFVVDGQLNAGGSWGCMDELFLLVGDTEIRDFTGDFTFRVDVFSSDRVGMVRMLDEDNFVRFFLDFNSGEHIFDSFVGGVYEELSDANLKLQPSTWYRIMMVKQGTQYTIYVDGKQILVTNMAQLGSGYVGVYAGTVRRRVAVAWH